jgi:hypothetical protein
VSTLKFVLGFAYGGLYPNGVSRSVNGYGNIIWCRSFAGAAISSWPELETTVRGMSTCIEIARWS